MMSQVVIRECFCLGIPPGGVPKLQFHNVDFQAVLWLSFFNCNSVSVNKNQSMRCQKLGAFDFSIMQAFSLGWKIVVYD